ncbi:MAG: cadmium-translocating P-type ATPase [Oscillospiraceae bacterium]|jgi:Cd2+/Zn2+-exporting ATPase|nr:cadmium-translocating P-type ATPase [Oscillospiraceae bacterium]
MEKEQKQTLCRILVSAALLIVALLLPVKGPWRLALFLVPYVVIGYDVVWEAIKNIAHGKVFDEHFLMSVATIGALCAGEYAEGIAVMLFYQVGELLEDSAVGHSRKSISALMDIRPDSANLQQSDGSLQVTAPEKVPVGSTIAVKPGERIPLDGTVLQGESTVDTSALTGESVPRRITAGDEALSGCINGSGLLYIRVTKPYGESTVSKVLELVENASSHKAKSEAFITKFARIYTPIVVFAAVILAVLPPLLFHLPFRDWVMRALNFLVVSCPCALVISVPLSFFGGIGGASRCGILIKGSNYMETLAKTGTVVCDKTGTLTKGTFRVTQTVPVPPATKEQLLETAALAESYSSHPIAASLRAAWGQSAAEGRVTDVKEIAGRGVQAQVDGHRVLAGSSALLQEAGLAPKIVSAPGTIVYVASDKTYLGYLIISDEIKENAAEAVAQLKQAGVRHVVMLTGDSKQAAQAVAEKLGIAEVRAELLPGGKVDAVEELLQRKDGSLVFMGDGINDAPVLARADVGVAMGALGSDAAIEAADVVLMDDDPAKLPAAIRISRKTLRIVHENIVFALVIKLIVLILSALGLATMWAAVFADVGVTILAILNASRALRLR